MKNSDQKSVTVVEVCKTFHTKGNQGSLFQGKNQYHPRNPVSIEDTIRIADICERNFEGFRAITTESNFIGYSAREIAKKTATSTLHKKVTGFKRN